MFRTEKRAAPADHIQKKSLICFEKMDNVTQGRRSNVRLPPEVNRVVYVRNLPFKISAEEMYDIFGKYGAIRQIRLGDRQDTRGTAFVVYEDIYDAKNAVDHLSGFNVCGRYLIVLYYQQSKVQKAADNAAKRRELDEMKAKLGTVKG
eukprot:gene32625-39444_t